MISGPHPVKNWRKVLYVLYIYVLLKVVVIIVWCNYIELCILIFINSWTYILKLSRRYISCRILNFYNCKSWHDTYLKRKISKYYIHKIKYKYVISTLYKCLGEFKGRIPSRIVIAIFLSLFYITIRSFIKNIYLH